MMKNKETIKYYIDESGDLTNYENGGTKSFLFGLITVEMDSMNQEKIKKLETEITNSAFYSKYKKKSGFHACEDYPDIQNMYFELLNTLQFRFYVIFLNKKTEFFKELTNANSVNEIQSMVIKRLIKNNILKNYFKKNIFIFERQGNKLDKEKLEKEKIIQNCIDSILTETTKTKNIDYSVIIDTKDNFILSIVDYVLWVIFKLCEGEEKNGNTIQAEHIKEKYELLEKKIALIIDFNNNLFYNPRKGNMNIKTLLIK